MALTPGTRIGPYEITCTLGAGGMGEVYRATDTNLKRQVAIKVLPESVATDRDRLARFQREAEVLASINHPNIAAIYGLEGSGGTTALVMELVEGPTLSDRITQGPIPVDEALPIAKQIAEALEAAHEQGIIHRDLKPANIKLRPDGTVKVLDFGLAKALEPAAAANVNATASPTITSPAMMTGVGMLLGTAAYMSPEQARGKTVDKRSDIWAFGCVLYEMLSGSRLFKGGDVSETLAAVLMREVDISALPPNVPSTVRELITGCLERDRRERIGDISTLLFFLRKTAIYWSAHRSVSARRITFGMASFISLVAGLILIVIGVAAWSLAANTPAASGSVRFEAGLGADASLYIYGPAGSGASTVLSPDGAVIAFVAQRGASASQLYVRRLEQLQAQALNGTEDANNPFFSPDSRWIAFFAEGKLKKVAVTGGSVVTLCDAAAPRGGTWADDGTIVFQASGNNAPLLRVPASGGNPEELITLADGEATQRWPQVLPGSRAVLFTSNSDTAAGYTNSNIVVQGLPFGARKVLQRDAYYGRYVRSGHLVFIRDYTLMAVRFDPDRLEVIGPPVPVIEGVASSTGNGGAQFSMSDTGTLVYLPGEEVDSTEAPPAAISWINRDGSLKPLRAATSDWSNPQFSPDGRHLTFDLATRGVIAVWVYDLMRDTARRLSVEQLVNDRDPIWTPDGRRIVFRSTRDNPTIYNLYWRLADGSGDVQRLTMSANDQFIGSWHPSGNAMAFAEGAAGGLAGRQDVMILPMEGDERSGWKPGSPKAFLKTPWGETSPTFSPNGRWLAYASNESGRNEVYVTPFPGPGGKWQVSSNGGNYPLWSATRDELFYQAPDNRIMVLPYVAKGAAFEAGRVQVWSQTDFVRRPRGRSVALHPDGDRFGVAIRQEGDTNQSYRSVVLVFNWFPELQRVVPTN